MGPCEDTSDLWSFKHEGWPHLFIRTAYKAFISRQSLKNKNKDIPSG